MTHDQKKTLQHCVPIKTGHNATKACNKEITVLNNLMQCEILVFKSGKQIYFESIQIHSKVFQSILYAFLHWNYAI